MRERVVGPGERHPQIIEHALPRQFPHLLGEGLVADRAGPFGEGLGQIGALGDCGTVHLGLLCVGQEAPTPTLPRKRGREL